MIIGHFVLKGAIEVMKERAMRDYTTVEALLQYMNITAEERELHKGLIGECLENEQKITECAVSTRNNMERISTVLGGIHKSMVAMDEALENLTKGAEELSLRMLPADKFYHE
jgi:hypothetical protein